MTGLFRSQEVVIDVLILPLRYKQIGIPSAAVVAVARKGQVFAVVREYREGIKSLPMCHPFKIFTIQIDEVEIKRESFFGLKIAREKYPFT